MPSSAGVLYIARFSCIPLEEHAVLLRVLHDLLLVPQLGLVVVVKEADEGGEHEADAVHLKLERVGMLGFQI